MSVSQILAGVSQIGVDQMYKTEAKVDQLGESYSYGKNVALGVGTAGMSLAFAGKMSQGLIYSAGGEPIVGSHGFGFVTGPGPQTGAGTYPDLRKASMWGKSGLYSTGGPMGSLVPQSMSHLDQVRGLASEAGKGVMRQSIATSLFPVGMTAYFAADAYASDGMTGLGKYMAADILGNYYGVEAGMLSLTVTDPKKAKASLNNLKSVTGGNIAHVQGELVKGGFVNRINPILNSGLLGRMLPVVGGIAGATVGMEVGAAIGSTATSMMGHGMDQNIGSFAGGFLGAVAGAKFGAYALSSLSRMGIVGAGVLATTAVVSNTMAALGSGFEKANRNRGLNYAGDTAAYFTQNAVTMRERAVQAMHKSHLNARSAFGQEASLMHMNRDMFSHYKRSL